MPLIKLDNNIKINYQLEGNKEGELLLLIHGYGSWMNGYDEIFALLTDNYLVLRSDLRGHGESDKFIVKDDYEATKKIYTINNFAEDNYLLLKKLGLLDKFNKINVYGHSMGGMIAQAFVLKYQKIINKLILGSTTYTMNTEGMKRLLSEYKSGKLGSLRDSFEITAKSAYTLKFKKEHPDFLKKEIEAKLKCPPEVIYGAMENFIYNFNVKDQLKSLKIPVLILTGDKDRLIPPDRSYEMNKLIPNSKLIVFKKQNHGINVEIAEQVVNEIKIFIQEPN
ncbi:MAG: alpha/beta fold hydrolase [Candidatus Hermodarchaeota archaeon]